MPMRSKKEFGDFQTPDSLASRVTSLVDGLFGTPEIVIEPTLGLGAFVHAAIERWGTSAEYIGYDINQEYVEIARDRLKQDGVQIFHGDFFQEDWQSILSDPGKARTLIIGNPPWVTNSDLGQLGSGNLPKKSNFQGLRGLDARTGKSNFDIAESMLIELIDALGPDGVIAMLCKTMTARKVLRHFWKNDVGLANAKLFQIDAKTEFNVAVDACLFYASGSRTNDHTATVFADLDLASAATKFGFVDGELVADIEAFQKYRNLEGESLGYTWRSGVKHDAAKVMEFTLQGETLVNGFGDVVEIEEDYVFPLLKSSDLGNGRSVIRKAALVTQRHTGDPTTEIKQKAPKTWAYLTRHADILHRRKSAIYKNRPEFSVFGIGPYSFAPWKVAISGLYKNISFQVIPPSDGRPVMIDDTCYSIACQSQAEANLLHELLSSKEATTFLKSLIFVDSKRPITIDVLRRLSVVQLARRHGKLRQLMKLGSPSDSDGTANECT